MKYITMEDIQNNMKTTWKHENLWAVKLEDIKYFNEYVDLFLYN